MRLSLRERPASASLITKVVEVAVVTEFKSQFNYVQTVFTVLNVNKVGSLREWAQGKLLLYFKTTRVFIRTYDLRKLTYVNCDRVHSERVASLTEELKP